MNRYERTIEILDTAIGGPAAQIGAHGAFWRGLTRDQFVVKKVFGLDLLSPSHGSDSNIVKALKGDAPFDDTTYPRMPVGYPPVPDDQIAFIEKWIDDGCPQDPVP